MVRLRFGRVASIFLVVFLFLTLVLSNLSFPIELPLDYVLLFVFGVASSYVAQYLYDRHNRKKLEKFLTGSR